MDKDHVLRTPAIGPSEYAILATDVQEFQIDERDTLWMLNSAHELRFRAVGASNWSVPETGVKSLMMSPDGTVYSVNSQSDLRVWIGGRKWRVMDRAVQSWGMLSDGTLYFLNGLGQVKRLKENSSLEIMASHVSALQVSPSGEVFVRNAQQELLHLTARDHWTILERGVRTFQIAPNGDLYLITAQQELRRRKPGDSSRTLQAGVQSFTVTSDGTVNVIDTQQRTTHYSSLGPYFVLPAFPPEAVIQSIDVPSDGAVLAAANLSSPSQNIPAPSLAPLAQELAAINNGGAGSEIGQTIGTAGATYTRRVALPSLRTSSTRYEVPPQRVVRNVSIVTEKQEPDELEALRIDPVLGAVQRHRVQFKSTIVFTHEQGAREELVVWIDHDHDHTVGDITVE